MPRQLNVNPQFLLEIFKRFQIFDDNQNLKPRSDILWKNISKELDSKITADAVNFYVRNNRWNLLVDLKNYFGLPVCDVIDIDACVLKEDIEESEYVPCNVNKVTEYPPIFFNLEIPEEEWIKIHPVSKFYKEKGNNEKRYRILQNGWTDIIAKLCFQKCKVPCAYSFSSAKVFESPESKVYLEISGMCNECGSKFKGYCLNKPISGEGITLKVHTSDPSGIPHNAKRKVTGAYRETIGKKLLDQKPRQWQLKMVENLSFGDPDPPFNPRKETLRKIKEEAINQNLGIEKNCTAIGSLLDLKHTTYAGVIRDVGIDRFHCFYWSPLQMSMYKELIKKTKKIELDATGQLVKSIEKKNGERLHIFLYQIVLKAIDGIQPAFQMLSEKHDTNFICYWLREILRDGAPTPPEADCDYSMALLNATCLAFNERKLITYLSDCFLYLTGEKLQHPLKCFIRIDIAHLIQIICRKKVFDGKLSKIKDFYVRCIGVISACTNINDFVDLLTATIVVAYSEYSGQNEIGKNSYCKEKQDFLLDRIETFTVEENDIYSLREYDHLEDGINENRNLIEYVERIHMLAKTEVEQAEKTEHLNAFYCPEIIPHLLKLSKHFPLWTNVMIKYFPSASNVASSARCEAYFKDLQHSDLGSDYQAMRVDKFLVKHIKSIDSISKLNCAARKRNAETAALNEKEKKRKKILNLD